MTAAYQGIRAIQIKTFTTTYAPVNGVWAWCGNALQPMEFVGRIGPAPGFGSVAFGGSVFDDLTGATTFSVGDLASPGGTFNNNFGSGVWVNNRLYGWSFGQAISPIAATFSYPLILGTNYSNPFFGTGNTLATPSGSPNVYANSNYMLADGRLYTSYTTGGVPAVDQKYAKWTLDAAIDPGAAFIIPFTQDMTFGALVPYNGVNYITTGYFGIGLTKYVIATDLTSGFSQQTMTIANPPACSIDLNAAINSQSGFTPGEPTYQGMLWVSDQTMTIGTKSFTGFGILVAPDFSAYQVIEIVPTDSQSANWTALLGDKMGKFDQHGILWLKAAGNASIIFKALATPNKIIQTYPPIWLPSPPDDTEIMLNAYRGNMQ